MHLSERIKRSLRTLEEIERAVVQTMPDKPKREDTTGDGYEWDTAKAAWVAEFRGRVDNVVRIYTTEEIAQTIGNIGPV